MSGASIQRRNNALTANPNVFTYPLASDINITTHGSDVYWAVCAVMGAASVAFILLSSRVPRSQRIFHYITAAITLVAAIAYFTMASNLGYAAIAVEFAHSDSKVSGHYREIFYVRYIDWFVTTPLLLMDVLLTSGMPWPTVLYTILLDEIMIVTGLVGALVASNYKWGYFTFAMVALFGIAYNVVYVGRKFAAGINADVQKVYTICGAWTIFLWFIYPIAWGVCEGANLLSPDSEAVFYGVLDVLAKPVFGAILLWGHKNILPATLGLSFRDYNDPILGAPNQTSTTSNKLNTEGANVAGNGTGTTTTGNGAGGVLHTEGNGVGNTAANKTTTDAAV